MPESLTGSGRGSLSSTYDRTSTPGPAGGVLIGSENLVNPFWVAPFGWIDLDLATAVLMDSLPAGSATSGLFVPPSPKALEWHGERVFLV